MTCYHPLPAYNTVCKVSGVVGVRIVDRSHIDKSDFAVPCGKCIGCRLDQAKAWTVRCVNEASLHNANCFVTLTYNNDNVPLIVEGDEVMGVTLHQPHVQKFMKALRNLIYPVKIRFFCCGEYGEKLQRPHYHLILFGYDFPDKTEWKKSGKETLYRSKLLEKCWKFGYSSVANFSWDCAAYVARYCTKKIGGKKAFLHYKGAEKEFSTMSRRPGIARDWIEKYKDDVYPHDYVVISGGKQLKPPRYYDKIYDISNPDDMYYIKEDRKIRAEVSVDNTPERLEVREKISRKNFNLKERSYENEDL